VNARALVRLQLPVYVLAAAPLVLGLRFGGYHPRHAGWVVLGLAAWACVQVARGRLSAPRSASGIATFALLGLVAWTTASIGWADASRHDAWVEAMRALGYAAAFMLGGSLLANARSYVRFATLTGAGIALLGLGVTLRMWQSDAPLRAFVAGRLDSPIGYAPGMAGLCLMGMLLLLGVACGAERRWTRTRRTLDLVASGAALGAAGLCGSLALLAQSRGTLPALLVGVLVSLVALPQRSGWLLRLGAIGVVLAAAHDRLGAQFTTQFELRQAPFTKGADAHALLDAAEAAAHTAGATVLGLTVALALVGAALVPVSAWSGARLGEVEARIGRGLAMPISVGVAALVLALLVLGAGRDGSPTSWIADQWHGCAHPPTRVDDPGASSSYFANTGTGRCDYYRVALEGVPKHPLLGLGAGNFRSEYVRERHTAEEPRVTHSLPLQLLAELGLVGAVLGATVLGCVLLAAWRFVRSGPGRDATFAGAIGTLGYWFAHASIDWLWQLPAVSLPALALAGGLVACVSPAQGRVRVTTAAPFAAAALLACVALVLPVTMADAKLRTARDPELRKRDAGTALQAARDAQSFDPTWAEPVITEGAILAARGDRAGAAKAGRRAVQLEPNNWSTQYDASGLIGLADTSEGRRAFQRARELNPRLPAHVPRTGSPAAEAGPDALQDAS
jgi:hypothetical protein